MAYQNYSGAWLPDTNQAGVRYVNGTWAGETLHGSAGADQFEGGGGRDTLVGGAGDDYYWVRDTRDVVQEAPGGGVDTIRIWNSYTLPASVENLIVFGDGSYAAGNDQANVVQGLDGAQFIYGGRGEDVLIGGPGADTFIVNRGEGHKVIQDFQSWSDKIRLVGGNLTTFEAVRGAMTQQGVDVVLNDGGTMILFRNATIGQFAARDFQLPLNYQALGAPTFNDDFNTLQTGSVWRTNFGYAGDGLNSFTLPRNGEQQIYVSPEFKGTTGAPLGLNPYAVSNGVLTITAQPVSDALSANIWGYDYTSGMLFSNYAQTFGYFEIRADLPDGQGLWPAFWLLGPDNNEIDILEVIGSAPHVPQQAVHSNAAHAGGANYMPNVDGFHTYGALWNHTDIVFYIDGTEVWRTPRAADQDKPMQMILNLAVGGNWPGSPDGTTPWPAQMQIDYVRAYGLPGASPQPPPPPPPPPTDTPGQVLTSSGPGSVLIGGAGGDTLNASQGADVLTGGGGADTFAFRAMPWSAGRITDFAPGVDRLDLSGLYAGGYRGSDPVADRYLSFASDGAGGTRVIVDVDGPAGPSSIPFHVVTLAGLSPTGLTSANVVGGAAPPAPPSPPPPPPVPAGVVLTATTPGSTLTGGAGNDTLNASQGADMLTGGGGGDQFVFAKLPWRAGHVTDFTDGLDRIDLRALAPRYTGGNAGRDVTFVSDGAGGAKVMVDIDGPGGDWPFLIATLDRVSPSALSFADWIVQ